ncbi:MAG: hypothetical protein SFZ23_02255 [Planctomycetota bacterium]|nr:hypothetical protein [Planctomycetota bacterium]
MERLKALVRAHARRPVTELADAIDRALDEFRGGGPRTDDITYVVARVTGESAT